MIPWFRLPQRTLSILSGGSCVIPNCLKTKNLPKIPKPKAAPHVDSIQKLSSLIEALVFSEVRANVLAADNWLHRFTYNLLNCFTVLPQLAVAVY